MGHLYLEHILTNQSASQVVGIRKDPAGHEPVDQPEGRFFWASVTVSVIRPWYRIVERPEVKRSATGEG